MNHSRNIGSAKKQVNSTDSAKSMEEILKPFLDKSNHRAIATSKAKPLFDPYADWDKIDLRTGTRPDCFNFIPTYDYSVDNKLEVHVGSNTDVVIKLCSYTTEKCILYVYVRSGEAYKIKNIPQDIYITLKLRMEQIGGRKFVMDNVSENLFTMLFTKKGDQVLDFHKEYKGTTMDGDNKTANYVIPSFSLSLDVIAADYDPDTYHTNTITEEEFNK